MSLLFTFKNLRAAHLNMNGSHLKTIFAKAKLLFPLKSFLLSYLFNMKFQQYMVRIPTETAASFGNDSTNRVPLGQS